MSHVVDIDAEVRDLAALRDACDAIGLELVEGQTEYRWWGHFVGDHPLPKGFEVADLGRCEHAIRVKGDPGAYEVGVVRRRDGRDAWTFLFDFYGTGGKRLEAVAGHRCGRLLQEYSAQVVERQAGHNWRIVRHQRSDGSLRLTLHR